MTCRFAYCKIVAECNAVLLSVRGRPSKSETPERGFGGREPCEAWFQDKGAGRSFDDGPRIWHSGFSPAATGPAAIRSGCACPPEPCPLERHRRPHYTRDRRG